MDEDFTDKAKELRERLDKISGQQITPEQGMKVMMEIIAETSSEENALVILAAGGPKGKAGMITMAGSSDDLVDIFKKLLTAEKRAGAIMSKALVEHIHKSGMGDVMKSAMAAAKKHGNPDCDDCPAKDRCTEMNKEALARKCGTTKTYDA